MTTMMTLHTSDGRTRRCTGRCYNAKGDVCTCVCNGLNHGVGRSQAIENTNMIAGNILEGAGIELPEALQLEFEAEA